jgi:hypothetical protein
MFSPNIGTLPSDTFGIGLSPQDRQPDRSHRIRRKHNSGDPAAICAGKLPRPATLAQGRYPKRSFEG